MSKPNIFILSVDSLRADYFQDVQGTIANLTNGVHFTNAVSTATKTSSSMVTLATGEYKDKLEKAGIPEEGHPKPLAEVFEDRGYECALWTDNQLFGAKYNFDRGFSGGDLGKPTLKKRLSNAISATPLNPLFPALEWLYFNIYNRSKFLLGKEENFYRPAELINEEVLEWLTGRSAPTFSWVHYMDPHHPYEPPQEYLEKSDFNLSWNRSELSQFTRQVIKSNGEGYTKEQIEDVKSAYGAACEYLGDEIISFVRDLIDKGYYDTERDMLVLTADHGECLSPNRYGMMGHVPPAIWEEVIRVPLVVSKPDWPQQTIDEQVSLACFYDIVTSMIHSETDPDHIGDDLSPEDTIRESVNFATNWGIDDDGTVQTYRGIRRADGKKLFGARIEEKDRVILAEYDSGDFSDTVLFDSDGMESPNGELADLWSELRGLAEGQGGLITEKQSSTAKLDEEHLRDLGYLE